MLPRPRGSNSVAARIIHETEFDEHSDSADDVLINGENMPVNTNQKCSPKHKSNTKIRKVVRVLDVATSIKKGHEKFVHFPARLHPWTTIKVSTFDLDNSLVLINQHHFWNYPPPFFWWWFVPSIFINIWNSKSIDLFISVVNLDL